MGVFGACAWACWFVCGLLCGLVLVACGWLVCWLVWVACVVAIGKLVLVWGGICLDRAVACGGGGLEFWLVLGVCVIVLWVGLCVGFNGCL